MVDSGKFQLVRSCQEPKEIATANTVLRVSKALLEDISSEDNIPFYYKFVEDVAKLESLNGALSPNSELRNDIVTFISENYTPGEAGHMICPACLTETPNILSICIRCHGSLVSWGEKEAEKDESTAPGMPERERRESGDGQDDEDEDVEMENEDQAEIDRLVRESKKNTEEAPDDDVDMTDARPSREQTKSERERQRNAPDQKVVFGNNTKEQQEEDEKYAKEQDQDEERREARMQLPVWTTRIIQASIIQCIDIAQNEDAIDSTARAMDCMILSYLKDRYRLYHLWTSVAPAQQYHDHVKRIRLVPEFDGYIPYVGETAEGELKEPTEEQTGRFIQRQCQERKAWWTRTGNVFEGSERNPSTMQDHEVLGPDRHHPSAHLLESCGQHGRGRRTATGITTGGVRLREEDYLRCLCCPILRLFSCYTTSTR